MSGSAGDLHLARETPPGVITRHSKRHPHARLFHSQAKSMLHKPDILSRIAMTIICLMVIIVLTAF